MHNRINGGAAPPTHRWLYRGELKSLGGEIARALPRTSDRPTRLFLEDAKEQIARILDPKFAPPASPVLSLPLRRALEANGAESCWQELTITRDGIKLQ
jgi:hypothetical protein